MLKTQNLTKYTFFAIALALAVFAIVPSGAKAYTYPSYSDSYTYPSYSDSYTYPSYSDSYTYPSYSDSSYTYPSYSDSSYLGYSGGYGYGGYSDYSDCSYSGSCSSYSSYADYGCSSCSYGGGYTYTQPPQIVYVPTTPPVVPPTYRALDASCVISPSNININDTVTLSGSASGGTGSYSYYWSGSDGISGSSQVITGRFTSIGSKTVSLTVTSGTQTVTRTCNAYVNSNYNYNYNYGYNYTNLTASCVAQPQSANVGDNVIWTAYPSGGNGTYTYSWTGSDGLSYGNSYQIQQRYTTPGTKSATVTVYSSTGQTVTAICNANIVGSIGGGTPISGIYLNEVPATGIDFSLKVALYILGLVLWSAFIGFMIVEKKKAKLALANRAKIEDFKQENLKRKGLL